MAHDKLKVCIFDISRPLVAMYNEIEDVKELSIAADNKYTERQLVKLGVALIKNTNDFEHGLDIWMARTIATRTWVNFKTHFIDAQKKLLQLRGPSMKNTTFACTANAITANVINEVTEELNTEREKYSHELLKVKTPF